MSQEKIPVFRYPITVTEDCIDVLHHTNNKEYLRWMEEAATAHSDALSWSTERYLEEGAGFVAAAHHIQYLRQTLLGDELVMYTWVATMEGKRSVRCYQLMRDKKVCMRGMTEWAFVDFRTIRSIPIPEKVLSSFTIIGTNAEELRKADVSWVTPPALLGG